MDQILYNRQYVLGYSYYFRQAKWAQDDKVVTLPIPHAFFKLVLTENNRGTIHMWSFIIPNDKVKGKLSDFRVSTTKVEKISGLLLWGTLVGTKMN